MSPFQGFVLGAVQGVTEFLPISSSAHLVLVPWLLGWPAHALTFDVALHMGTLAALLAYFWRDWWRLAAAWLPAGGEATAHPPGNGDGTGDTPEAQRALDRRLGLGLVVANVPAVVVGGLFADQIEASLRAPAIIALLVMAAAVVLAVADRRGRQTLGLDDVGVWQALGIGAAQALALAPGVSRSGITMAAALFLGLTRAAAARYTFLLATPITAAAGVFQLRHLVRAGVPPDERAAFALGIGTSLVVGVLAIGGLLRYLRRRSLAVFVAYRIALGVFVLVVALR